MANQASIQPSFFTQHPDTHMERPVDLEAQEKFQQDLQLTANQAAQIVRIQGYQAVLHTFGEMNTGENFQNRFKEHSPVVHTVFEPTYGTDGAPVVLANSTNKHDKLVTKAKDEIGTMLGFSTLIKTGVITEEQAAQLTDATYENYEERFGGIENKTARTNELAKARRRIKKVESTPKNA